MSLAQTGKGRVSLRQGDGTLVVNVSPGEVLLLDQITNYRDDADRFGLASIKISGPSGSVQFEGEQARTQFKKEGRSKYIVRYW